MIKWTVVEYTRIKCADCPNCISGRQCEHYPMAKTNKQKSTFSQHIVNKTHSMHDLYNGLEVSYHHVQFCFTLTYICLACLASPSMFN